VPTNILATTIITIISNTIPLAACYYLTAEIITDYNWLFAATSTDYLISTDYPIFDVNICTTNM
jgi:hypothetical protein